MLGISLLLVSLGGGPGAADADLARADAHEATRIIDRALRAHWERRELTPSGPAPELEFLRRLYLDIVGRVPAAHEAERFAADEAPDKLPELIRFLVHESPEFPIHFGRILEGILQEKHAGDREFAVYLGRAAREGKGWDAVFREVLLGPWNDDSRPAQQFLVKRAKSLDEMTTATTRAFFGVDISCAKCHDHPLVDDWKQDHYFGMAAFFNRLELKKNKKLAEKPKGEVEFVTTGGEKRVARPRFLSGDALGEKAAEDGSALETRRKLLVGAALEDAGFFSRAIVNRMWAHFLGHGIVNPVDQMHSKNPPVIEGVLDELAADLVKHDYRLDRLVEAIVSSRVYALSSAPPASVEDSPSPDTFAHALLRPLSPRQFAASVALTVGNAWDEAIGADLSKLEKFRSDLDGRAKRLSGSGRLDAPGRQYQSSAREALYLSNHADLQKLISASGKGATGNLVTRLMELEDTAAIAQASVWATLGRKPQPDEVSRLARFVETIASRREACEQLVWALVTSAEFRFNH